MRATALVLSLGACGTTQTSGGAAGADAGTTPEAGATTVSPCAVTRAFVERCGADLNCGASGFDAWCAANDSVINSDAYRRAQTKCLPEIACDANALSECESKHYATETPTAAQRALVEAYCGRCEPGVAACAANATSRSSSDIYVAAWELGDALADEIRTKCTGATLDAGADCAKAFGSCAAEVYLDRVPNCP